MNMEIENSATIAIVLLAVGILVWGYYRSRPFGKLGLLAWLQSVILMAPWLLFFALFAAGIYLNLAAILFLLLGAAGLYIFLGKKLRAAGQEELLRERAARIMKEAQESSSETPGSETPGSETPGSETPGSETSANNPSASRVLPVLEGINAEDLKKIQGIFGINTFFATQTIPYQDGAIFKGNLRGEVEECYSRLAAALEERVGDRYRLFLVPNPEGKPVVVVLPRTNEPQPATVGQKVLFVVLVVVTIATSLETGGLLLGFDFYNNLDRFAEVLPLGLGLWIVLLAHELGHQAIAKRHNVRFSLPFFIPASQLGCFGALNRFESLLPNRSVLFDIAFAGPAVGGSISLVMLLIGLLLSHEGSAFQMPSQFFQGSALVGSLAKITLGSALQQELVDIHPLVALGWLGLVITAINLFPAGQLDGGRMIQAIYGRQIAGRATIATLIFLGIASFVNPLALYWAILIVFLQRNLERPSLNEISEPDDARAALCLLALFLAIATVIPLTPGVAGRLGIGG